MPFSQQSVDFLFENRLHDSREWFRDHKQTYAEQVTEPMKQLILDVAPAVLCSVPFSLPCNELPEGQFFSLFYYKMH